MCMWSSELFWGKQKWHFLPTAQLWWENSMTRCIYIFKISPWLGSQPLCEGYFSRQPYFFFNFIFGVPIATILKGGNLLPSCFSDHPWFGSPYPTISSLSGIGGPGWPQTRHVLAPALSAGMGMHVAPCLAWMHLFVLSYQTGSWWKKIIICIYVYCVSQLSMAMIKRMR